MHPTLDIGSATREFEVEMDDGGVKFYPAYRLGAITIPLFDSIRRQFTDTTDPYDAEADDAEPSEADHWTKAREAATVLEGVLASTGLSSGGTPIPPTTEALMSGRWPLGFMWATFWTFVGLFLGKGETSTTSNGGSNSGTEAAA